MKTKKTKAKVKQITPKPEQFTCEAAICRRAAEGGSKDFRAITSDLDHLVIRGLHYHLHCAPPAVQTDKYQQVIAESVPPLEGGPAIEELITRVTRYVEEAPQIEREPLLYRAHVLGVLHQAKAMERIADYLESIQVSADQIVNAVATLCAELVKPEASEMAREIIRQENAEVTWDAFIGRHAELERYLRRAFPDEELPQPRRTATGPDAEPDPAEDMRRVEGGE